MKLRGLSGLGHLGIVAALAGVPACGGDDKPPPLPGNGFSGNAGSGGQGGSGAGGSTGVPGAPIVTVDSPVELTDPNAAGVLASDRVDVLCTASQSTVRTAKPVAASSVKIELLDSKGEMLKEAAGVSTQNALKPDEYSAQFDVTEAVVATGPVAFRCSAADTSVPPKIGSDTNRTFIDHGPAISVIGPKQDEAKPLQGAVNFEFQVAPAQLAPGDTGALVTDVSLKVLDVDFGAPPEVTPGIYSTSIDFNDRTIFTKVQPDGPVPVIITATNSRPVTGSKSYSFNIDGKGPIITITSHKNNFVVSGRITLAFEVKDDVSGVDKTSVSVKLNNEAADKFDPMGAAWTELNGKYGYTFDTRIDRGSDVQINVVVTATDLVGNTSVADSATLTLNRDDYPPLVDLDPANVREVSSNQMFCSNSFDPVGSAAPDDLEIVPNGIIFRALFWEQTNSIGAISYPAGMDNSSTHLYLQPDLSKPLLKDTNGDTHCDELDLRAELNVLDKELKPVPTQGAAWYGNETTLDPVLACPAQNGTSPPALLCNKASDMFRVTRHTIVSSTPTPVIYALGDLVSSFPDCTGSYLELKTTGAQSGNWICVAARGADKAGNVGISRPLRVCFSETGAPCAGSPPSCTDGCTPPPRFQRQTVPQ